MIRARPWARLLVATALMLALGSLGAALAGRPPALLLPCGALGLLLVAFVWGIFSPASGLFALPLLAVAPARAGRRLALTFDDGPDETQTRALLDLLDARGHKATFFTIGARAAGAPALLAELVRRGHGLGNHSFSHAYTTPFWAPRRLADDLRRAQALFSAAGARVRFFRPPVGLLSPRVVAAARQVGLELVGWTATARDGRAGTTVEAALGRLGAALRPGAILVLHDAVERGRRSPIAAAVLPRLLDLIEAQGLHSVTLDALLDEPG